MKVNEGSHGSGGIHPHETMTLIIYISFFSFPWWSVPSSFDYDSQTQQPVDRWQRKELNHAVVEYIAPTEYMVRPPQPLVYMILIDVSYPAIQCGMVATAATTILETLDRIPNDEGRTKIGIITVDSSIHFYNLNVRAHPCQRPFYSACQELMTALLTPGLSL
jgi:hypothetical protein